MSKIVAKVTDGKINFGPQLLNSKVQHQVTIFLKTGTVLEYFDIEWEKTTSPFKVSTTTTPTNIRVCITVTLDSSQVGVYSNKLIVNLNGEKLFIPISAEVVRVLPGVTKTPHRRKNPFGYFVVLTSIILLVVYSPSWLPQAQVFVNSLLAQSTITPEPTKITVLPTATRLPPTQRPKPTIFPTYTITPTPTTNPIGQTYCTNALPSQVIVGSYARVNVDMDGNFITYNLRVESDVNSAVISGVDSNTRLKILSGPKCGSGYTWWFVETNPDSSMGTSLKGWMAESVDGYYHFLPR